MHDYDTGLDMDSFQVIADFAVDGVAGGPEPGGEVQAEGAGRLGAGRWPTPLAACRRAS